MAAPYEDLAPHGAAADSTELGSGSVVSSMMEKLESLNNQIEQTDEEAKQLVKTEYEAIAARSRQSAVRQSMWSSGPEAGYVDGRRLRSE